MTHGKAERLESIGRAALFFALWFAAAFFFFGDLGKWMDDWSFHARDVATGEILWNKLFSLDPINTKWWRPLHIHAAIGLQTIFWNHDWTIHLILAIIHGINAWMLWRILGRLCSSPQAPALAALLFLISPIGHEAIFWNSTIGTGMGLWWLLACILAVQRFAAGEIGWKGLLLRAPLLLTLGWWYEQSAACAPVVAAAYLACVPATITTRRKYTIAGALAAAAVFGGMIYAALMVLTTNPQARGGAQSLVRAHEFWPQVQLILGQAWDHLTLAKFIPGALSQGWLTIRSRPVESGAIALFALASFAVFGSWWMHARVLPAPAAKSSVCTRRFWGASIGAGILAASMVPAIAVNGQWFAARLAYTPAMGVLIVLAIGFDILIAAPWAQRASTPGRFARGTSLAALGVACVLGATMLIGVQSVWHIRSRADKFMAAEFRRVIPSPAPGTVFAPMQSRWMPTKTGSWAFDVIGSGPLEFHWSAASYVRYAYRRGDLHAFAVHTWQPPGHRLVGVRGATETGLVVERRMVAGTLDPSPQGGDEGIVRWERLIPIRLLKGGRIGLADSWQIEDEANPANDRALRVGTGEPLPVGAEPGWAAVVAAVPPASRPAESARVEWKLVGPDGRGPLEQARAARRSAAGRAYEAFTLHPAVGSLMDRSELVAQLGPSERARVVSARVALLDQTNGKSDGVRVSIELAGEVVGTETVTHERLVRTRRWVVVRGLVPPMREPRECRIVVRPGAASDPNADWCTITPPVIVDEK